LEYLDNAVDWYIGTDIAEEFADSIFRVIWEDGGSKVVWNSVSVSVPIYGSHIPEDGKLVLLSYLFTFSCFLTFINSFCYYVFLPFISPVFLLVCLSLYCSSVRLIVAELAGPTQSYPNEIRGLSQPFVVLCQFVILAFKIRERKLFAGGC
jgi:hypothetical protein